jgi:hypothetical protein
MNPAPPVTSIFDTRARIPDFMTTPAAEYVFLTELYNVQWSSIRFYAEMEARIREVLERRGCTTRSVTDLASASLGPSSVVVVDAAAILALHERRQLARLLDTRFVLVIGENPDRRGRRFMGWTGPFGDLTFRRGNLLYRLLQASARASWQNERMRDILLAAKRPEDVCFFAIDGYRSEDVIAGAGGAQDIDVLVYGGMSYKRRATFVMQLLQRAPSRRIVVCQNVFALDELIARSKIVVHVNSVDGCYHVPYGKIVKPLANHKILFVEQTEELDRCDLRPFIRPFTLRRFKSFLADINDTIEQYDHAQAHLDAMNPRQFLQERYDFDTQVRRLFAI